MVFYSAIDLPRNVLPQNVTASLTGAVGYFWFGNQSAELGGFPLPAYLNWHERVEITDYGLPFATRHQKMEQDRAPLEA
jgi:hypothetical protein